MQLISKATLTSLKSERILEVNRKNNHVLSMFCTFVIIQQRLNKSNKLKSLLDSSVYYNTWNSIKNTVTLVNMTTLLCGWPGWPSAAIKMYRM